MIKFNVTTSSSKGDSRCGIISSEHGEIETPIFMPVGTQGSVKSVRHDNLVELGSEIILGNTFHLYLRPGHEIISEAGGLHQFISWDKPMLTDSGGFQVYSLSGIRKITEEGVKFASPIDGSKHFFSPERAIEIQQHIGADIIMAFDECTPYPCEYNYAKSSMKMTHRWLDRCLHYKANAENIHPYTQSLAPIVQGSVYKDLRVESAKYIASKGTEINAIGGLSVGEPAEIMYEMTEEVCHHLPTTKARYLMGVGTPANLLECIDRGIDMFDCVLPTRNARHGHLYTYEGVINIKNAKWKKDFSPIDPSSSSKLSRTHSKSYLRHLFVVKEAFGLEIASIHNLSFYLQLIHDAREAIKKDEYRSWKKEVLPRITSRL